MSPPRRVEIALRGPYRLQHLERLIRDLEPALYANEPAVFHVDLAGLASIGPTAIALLSATLKRLQEDGLVAEGSTFVRPRSPLTDAYIQRMDVVRHLGVDLDEEFERHEPRGFRPCQHFDDEHGSHVVAREMTAALEEKCQTDEVARGSILVCLDELCENVVHHADSGVGGFACAQGWNRRPGFEVGIVDLGVGIHASLTKNARYADIPDDVTAIARALEPKVTATPERNSGMGLAVTRLLLEANGGQFVVRSGLGGVYMGAANGQLTHPLGVPGTIVALAARTDRTLDLRTIYEHLADRGFYDDEDDDLDDL